MGAGTHRQNHVILPLHCIGKLLDRITYSFRLARAQLNAARQGLRSNDKMRKNVWKSDEKEGTCDSPNHLTPVRCSNSPWKHVDSLSCRYARK